MTFLAQHEAILAIAGYWVFSAIVGGMPAPDTTSGRGYLWAYNALHILAGNLTSAVSARYPALPGDTPKTEPPKP